MKRWLRLLGMLGLILLALVLGLAGGVLLDRQVWFAIAPPSNIPADATSNFQLMAEAWNVIQQIYVDRTALQPSLLTYGAISGMVDALGDTGHSRFLTPQMVKEQNNFTQGQFEGVGAEVQMKDGHVVIVAPIDDSPAQRAGLRPGEIILKVNGEDVTGLPLDQAVGRILGPAGTSVTLTILNPNTGRTQDVTLVRARIALHNVTWESLPGTKVAHVRIAAFSQGVTQDLQEALADIQQQGLTGLILDLRNDPGGLLDEAVGTASQFLKGGTVLLEKDAQGQTTPVAVQAGGVAPDIPMVVLVNGGTASAAEIVSGALQDAQRATLVGETTFGTGTVLGEFRLSDGSALLLATEEWLTPSGRVIWHQGISPDVIVSLPPDVAPLHPTAERDMTPAQLQSSGDVQLSRALDLLAGSGGAPQDKSTRTVTLASDGQMITLRVGEQFLLKLGDDYDWAVRVVVQ
jgi:carboxyl-terminal processing protease